MTEVTDLPLHVLQQAAEVAAGVVPYILSGHGVISFDSANALTNMTGMALTHRDDTKKWGATDGILGLIHNAIDRFGVGPLVRSGALGEVALQANNVLRRGRRASHNLSDVLISQNDATDILDLGMKLHRLSFSTEMLLNSCTALTQPGVCLGR